LDGLAFIAAPKEHVFGALNDDIVLVTSPEAVLRALPEDCNIHWRSFSSQRRSLEHREQTTLEQLQSLLQTTGVVLKDHDEALVNLCKSWSIPMRLEANALRWPSQSATTFLWIREQKSVCIAHLGTVFACWYGIEEYE